MSHEPERLRFCIVRAKRHIAARFVVELAPETGQAVRKARIELRILAHLRTESNAGSSRPNTE